MVKNPNSCIVYIRIQMWQPNNSRCLSGTQIPYFPGSWQSWAVSGKIQRAPLSGGTVVPGTAVPVLVLFNLLRCKSVYLHLLGLFRTEINIGMF